ncbi:MAG: glycosyltransferase family 4 protein [Mucilaginibacter sp.]
MKEARTLSAAGFEVHIINSVYAADLIDEDNQLIKDYKISVYHATDLTGHNISAWFDRLAFKIGRVLIQYAHTENVFALGYGSKRYIKLARSVQADLYICHQELATFVGNELLKEGYKVASDLEDWYSEDLLPDDRKMRPIKLLKKLEVNALKNSAYCTTTSVSMAQKLADTYGCKKPDVVYNAFPAADVISAEKQFDHTLKLFWFSQTIGPGRGLEEFISLLNRVPSMLELHLLGNVSSDYREMLIASMLKQHRVVFHSIVSNEELPAKIGEFDIGLALERTSPPSRNYTITNKFFQYIGSGLPVIATETEGQMEMFQQFKPGLLLPQKASEEDINRLIQWLGNAEGLKLARQQALEAARFFSWEQQAKKIIRLVEQALGTGC